MKNTFRILLAIYSILILVVSVTPSMGVGDIQVNRFEFRVDYILHALAFIVLPVFAFIASDYSCSSRQWFFYLVIATLLALGTEFVQIFIATRTFNPFDILSNLFGLSLGIISARIWCRIRIKRQKQGLA